MQENNSNAVYRAFLEIIKEGIFWFAIAIAYFKTAELMSYFSPKQIMGFVGIEQWYGLGAAALVEGTFVVMKYRLQFDDNPYSKLFSAVMAIGAVTMSFIAQGLDTAVVKGTVENLPLIVQQFMGVFVPAIPVIVMTAITISDAVTRQYRGSTESTTEVLRGFLSKVTQQDLARQAKGSLSLPEGKTSVDVVREIRGTVDVPVKRGPGRPRKVVPVEQKTEADNSANPTPPTLPL